MKEKRFFYTPDTAAGELPEEEAKHALRVLRLQTGDEIHLIDGKGAFHRAEITLASSKHCCYRIVETQPQEREWTGRIHLAMAPTKMMERTEWFAEKATEIGIDEFSFLNCRLSERRQMRLDRIENKVISAVKQSRKAWMPVVNDMMDFKDFVLQQEKQALSAVGNDPVSACPPLLCIAHCYNDIPRQPLFPLPQTPSALVLIGPEGDFHHDEVLFALDHGFRSVSLGTSRLRTETAALSAVMMMRLAFA